MTKSFERSNPPRPLYNSGSNRRIGWSFRKDPVLARKSSLKRKKVLSQFTDPYIIQTLIEIP